MVDPVGPELDSSEDVFRAILYPNWWLDDENRPTSAAFDDSVFSVDRCSRSTADETKSRFREVTRLAKFNCGEARTIGFDSRDELDQYHPENLAHAHVYFLDYQGLSKKGRKTRCRQLVEICAPVIS